MQPHFTPTSSPPTPLHPIAISVLAINSVSRARQNQRRHFPKLCKASQTIRSTPKPALKPDTLDKLKAKPPQDSTDFDSRHWPTAEEMDALRCDDDWQNTEPESFPVKKIKQHFARRSPLSAHDVDGWRPREHIA